MSAYYNEIDPYAAQWLRNLIDAGLIPPGDVDERSIVDVEPSELARYTQCHFFAGIGGWPYALRLAGWPDDRPVWTGSCPCQPFSVAGARKGTDDERHLWPAFRWLIAQRRPATIFGEQVASEDGRSWLAGVRADLEAMGYVVGAADLCAAGVGAPHVRQRLWWVAHAVSGTEYGGIARAGVGKATRRLPQAAGGLGVADCQGRKPGESARAHTRHRSTIEPTGGAGGLADSIEPGLEGHAGHGNEGNEPGRHGAHAAGSTAPSGATGFWSAFDLIPCLDGKARRVEPGTFPLAHGVPARVGKLRAYGNAIVPEGAEVWIETCQETLTRAQT